MNKILLVGRITRDLELKKTSNGISYVRFTVAIDRPFTNQNNQRVTDFINCVVWRGQADNLAKYQGKGSLISLEGILTVTNFENNGTRSTITEVLAESINYLERKDTVRSSNTSYAPSNNTNNTSNSNVAANDNNPFANTNTDFSSIDDDDLPF